MHASSDIVCNSNSSGGDGSQQHEMICLWFLLLITECLRLCTVLFLVLSFTPTSDNKHYLSFYLSLSLSPSVFCFLSLPCPCSRCILHTMLLVRCVWRGARQSCGKYIAFGVVTLTSLHKIPQSCRLLWNQERKNDFCRKRTLSDSEKRETAKKKKIQ